jgi:hypothetical protein
MIAALEEELLHTKSVEQTDGDTIVSLAREI